MSTTPNIPAKRHIAMITSLIECHAEKLGERISSGEMLLRSLDLSALKLLLTLSDESQVASRPGDAHMIAKGPKPTPQAKPEASEVPADDAQSDAAKADTRELEMQFLRGHGLVEAEEVSDEEREAALDFICRMAEAVGKEADDQEVAALRQECSEKYPKLNFDGMYSALNTEFGEMADQRRKARSRRDADGRLRALAKDQSLIVA